MLPDYQNYDVNDFLEDDHFIRWRTASDAEISDWWKKWMLSHPEKKEILQKAIRQYNILIGFKRILPTAGQHDNTWLGIERHIDLPSSFQKKSRNLYWLAAAAVMTAVITAAIFLFNRSGSRDILISSGDKSKTILLPDSSLITLNRSSALKYKSNNAREIWVDGSAYFEVKNISRPNQSIPFIVHAGKLQIKVLGTVFTIVNTPEQCLAVLKEGKIQVAAFSKNNILSPGEKITVRNNETYISAVNAALYNPWTEGNFHFDNTNMDELSDIVSVFYGRQLIINDKPKLKTKSISGIVTANDTTTFVKTLEVLLNAHIDLDEKKMTIYPK